MSAAEEAKVPAVEKPVEEVKAPKLAKEKKPKAPKEKKPKQAKTASHPPYLQMIKDALIALNEKGGSSPYAIAKYMEEKHKAVLPANFKKILGLQLKNQAARGKLVKIKASYKLTEAAKKENTAPPKRRRNRVRNETKSQPPLLRRKPRRLKSPRRRSGRRKRRKCRRLRSPSSPGPLGLRPRGPVKLPSLRLDV
ncbi:Histone H1 [Glycine soja]|nr:Histone H1 [Glycine soja]